MNWYPEAIESGAGASAAVLYPSPGLKFFTGQKHKAITSATLKVLSSHAPGTTACTATFTTNLAVNPTSPPAYNYTPNFMQSTAAWTNRTDSEAWNPSTNQWPDGSAPIGDITNTVVSIFDAGTFTHGAPVGPLASYTTTPTAGEPSAWVPSTRTLYWVSSTGTNSLVVSKVNAATGTRTDIPISLPYSTITVQAAPSNVIVANVNYFAILTYNWNASSADVFLYKSDGTFVAHAGDATYSAFGAVSAMGIDPLGGNAVYYIDFRGHLYGCFATWSSVGGLYQSLGGVYYMPTGDNISSHLVFDSAGNLWVENEDTTTGGGGYISGFRPDGTSLGDTALRNLVGAAVSNIWSGVYVPTDNSIIWGSQYTGMYKWDIPSRRVIAQLADNVTAMAQYVGSDGMLANGYHLINPVTMTIAYNGSTSDYTGVSTNPGYIYFSHQYDAASGSLFMLDYSGNNVRRMPIPLDHLATPDVLTIYDVHIDVTYTDGSTGLLYPSMNFVDQSIDGSATISNPTYAGDQSITTAAIITRTRSGGLSPPILQLYSFADVSAIKGNSVRGLYTFKGRTYAVGNNFVEIMADGTQKVWGDLPVDASPVTMAANNFGQLIICTGGQLWLFDTNFNTLTPILNDTTGSPLPAFAAVDFIDGYFLALVQDSYKFQISAFEGQADPTDTSSTPPLGGASWNPLDYGAVQVYADNVLAMLVDHREVWFWGPKRSVVYYNSGDPNFPFAPIPSGYIEQGIIAPASPVRLDNSVFWLGADERGGGIGFRSNGYTPIRISNHAIEYAWKKYSRIDDAVGYAYQDTGHAFWVLYFPTANATWVYDAATGMWHERGRWDTTTGIYEAHRSRCHVFAYKKHLVGDWKSGRIFEMNTDFLTDDVGDPTPYMIRRFRRAPHVTKEQERSYHHKLRVHLEAGLGPMPPLTGPSLGLLYVSLQDASGGLWQVAVQDNGTTAAVYIGTGFPAPQPYILADLAYLPYTLTCYTLGADTSGNLLISPIVGLPVQSGYYKRLVMATIPSMLQSSISVQFGALFIDLPMALARDPLITLRWSDDGAHTWSNEYTRGAGQAGDFRKRVEWRRLGMPRDRVYEVSVSDPIAWRLVDAYLFATPDYEATERYSKMLAKMA